MFRSIILSVMVAVIMLLCNIDTANAAYVVEPCHICGKIHGHRHVIRNGWRQEVRTYFPNLRAVNNRALHQYRIVGKQVQVVNGFPTTVYVVNGHHNHW